MSYIVLFLILFTVTLSACAQLALKLGVSQPNMVKALQTGILESLLAAALSPLIWAGLMIYALSVALWVWVLSKVDLSVAYPFVGIGFIITMTFGIVFLNENVSLMRICGTLLIMIGCIFVGRSA